MTEDYKTKYPIGSKWRTRGGYVVEIVYHNDHSKTPLVVVSDKIDHAISLSNDGKVPPFFGDNILDLIEPYTEPKRGVVYMNVYEDGGFGSTYLYKEEADAYSDCRRIACIRIEWTEGQFDE